MLIDRSVSLARYELPFRGPYGQPRPPALHELALPPGPMPSRWDLRPLKAWRYVGVFGPELMLCLASVRIGPARQSFWAVWDSAQQRLYERTRRGGDRGLALEPGRARLSDAEVTLDLRLEEEAGVETICASGGAYSWTRKQGGIRALGTISIDGRSRPTDARAIIDDTAAYYERHTHWYWSAGVGMARDGRAVAWNLVDGVNDPPVSSERSVWLAGDVFEPPPVRFASDLSAVDELRFDAQATRERRENLLLVRSFYRQPFGKFAGVLPGVGVELAQGFGVMEEHDVWW
jgi:hypothetical protein